MDKYCSDLGKERETRGRERDKREREREERERERERERDALRALRICSRPNEPFFHSLFVGWDCQIKL